MASKLIATSKVMVLLALAAFAVALQVDSNALPSAGEEPTTESSNASTSTDSTNIINVGSPGADGPVEQPGLDYIVEGSPDRKDKIPNDLQLFDTDFIPFIEDIPVPEESGSGWCDEGTDYARYHHLTTKEIKLWQLLCPKLLAGELVYENDEWLSHVDNALPLEYIKFIIGKFKVEAASVEGSEVVKFPWIFYLGVPMIKITEVANIPLR